MVRAWSVLQHLLKQRLCSFLARTTTPSPQKAAWLRIRNGRLWVTRSSSTCTRRGAMVLGWESGACQRINGSTALEIGFRNRICSGARIRSQTLRQSLEEKKMTNDNLTSPDFVAFPVVAALDAARASRLFAATEREESRVLPIPLRWLRTRNSLAPPKERSASIHKSTGGLHRCR